MVDVAGQAASRWPRWAPVTSRDIEPPGEGVQARARGSQPLVELRVPFTLDRQAIDDVERGAQDSDWQPVKDAARQIAFAEDRAVFEGYAAAGIAGITGELDRTRRLTLPAEAADYPDGGRQARHRAAAGRRRRARTRCC